MRNLWSRDNGVIKGLPKNYDVCMGPLHMHGFTNDGNMTSQTKRVSNMRITMVRWCVTLTEMSQQNTKRKPQYGDLTPSKNNHRARRCCISALSLTPTIPCKKNPHAPNHGHGDHVHESDSSSLSSFQSVAHFFSSSTLLPAAASAHNPSRKRTAVANATRCSAAVS